MNRAYSILDIKEIGQGADGRRTFKGIASTPATDREQDIVEPQGAKFKLPLPLCWMHNTRDPVGWVTAAKVTDRQIEIEGEIANISEPLSLKDRLDTAWAMLKGKLVRGLSIGFNPLESARIEGTFGTRWISWEWLELSPVTIAANADASITSIKSADQAIRRAASGAEALPVVRLNLPDIGKPSPGDSGKIRRKGVIYLA